LKKKGVLEKNEEKKTYSPNRPDPSRGKKEERQTRFGCTKISKKKEARRGGRRLAGGREKRKW